MHCKTSYPRLRQCQLLLQLWKLLKKTSEAAANKLPLSKEDIRRIFLQLQKTQFERLKRNQYIQSVAKIYGDDNMFNTSMVLNKDGIYLPPVAKMAKYGLVESLIFYSQGGNNFEMLSSNMQMEQLEARLTGFHEFYAGPGRFPGLLASALI